MDKNRNGITALKEKKSIVFRRIFLLLPLIISVFLIANQLSCVVSDGSICWNGLSKESRTLTYSFTFYFYIFYIILLIFMRKPFKRVIVAWIITILFPFIIMGSAYLAEDPSHELSGVIMIGAYITVAGPGISLDSFLNDIFSRPFLKKRSIEDLKEPYMGKDIYVLGDEARYQSNSVIVPVFISGDYLRAVRITPESTSATKQVESLFTVGPHSYEDRDVLEAEYERELLNRGIMEPDEWDISERNPVIWKAIRQRGGFRGAFRVKRDNKPAVLLVLIEEKGEKRSRDLWFFDKMNPGKPLNLTAFNGSSERLIENVTVSNDLKWIYVMGRINLQESSDTLYFTRITPSGERDYILEQEWKTFLDSSGFSSSFVDSVVELLNGCLIVAFSPHQEEAYPVTWLRLAQRCGSTGFEMVNNGKFQMPFNSPKAKKIYELTDGNLLVMHPGWFVSKLNMKRKEYDNNFRMNLDQSLQLLPTKGEEPLSTIYNMEDTRFGVLTPHPWLVFHSYKESPRIIVTDLDGIKLFEADNF